MAIANDVLYRSEKGSALTFAELDNNFNILAVAIDNIQISNNSVVVVRDLAGNFSANTITANLAGNSATSTKFLTARTINGVSFDGTANITVTANTTNTLTRGTYLTGSNFNGSAATTWAVDADTSATALKVVVRDASGNFAANTITSALTGNASTATTLQTARTIGDVSFNGSASIVPERITFKDTRSTDFSPYTYPGVTIHLKTNSTDGLNDSGTYHGILNLQHWSDVSGGRNHQLGFTDAGNMHHRSSTNTTIWSTWSKLYDTGDAASIATASTLVLRDSSSNFSANTITAALTGNASTATTLQTARTINGVSFNGSNNITITANTNAVHTRGTYLTGSNFDGSTATTWAVDADSLATASKVVVRDASGNFAANTITATTFSGSFTGAVTGTASNSTQLDGNAETSYLRYRGNITETTLNDTTTDADRTSGWYRVSYPGATDALLDIGGIGGSTPRVQFRFNYGDSIWFRAARDTSTTWDSVTSRGVLLLHSGNYNSYAPTLTGTGASGYWAISVTGSANTATTLTTPAMIQGTDIPGSTDLNTYTTPGFYHQNTNANATSGTNYPNAVAGMLEVLADGLMVYQRYTVYSSGQIYTRSYYNGTWYAWRLELDSLNYNSYAPTLTGTGASGTWDITSSSTNNAVTFNSSGSGAASGTIFNGSTAYTISYNTLGASPLAGSASLTTVGTITSGVWNAGTVTSNGNISANGSINITAATTETRALQIGVNRADNGFSILDFIGDTTYADYGLRISRGNTGADSSSSVVHRGTGPLYISAVEAGIIGLRTSNTTRFVIGELGQFGIGGSTYGTSGQVLTSGGASAAPSWTSAGFASSVVSNKLGSRATATTYQNTTNGWLLVSVSMSNNGQTFLVGSTTGLGITAISMNLSGSNMTYMVPPLWYYRVTGTVISFWTEGQA
jgi:hypothetical protein